MIAAASNTGVDSSMLFPARMHNVTAVHAAEPSGQPRDRNTRALAFSSNLSALGTEVSALGPNGQENYRSGCSVAAATCAGICIALWMIAQRPVPDKSLEPGQPRLANWAPKSRWLRAIVRNLAVPVERGYMYLGPGIFMGKSAQSIIRRMQSVRDGYAMYKTF